MFFAFYAPISTKFLYIFSLIWFKLVLVCGFKFQLALLLVC